VPWTGESFGKNVSQIRFARLMGDANDVASDEFPSHVISNRVVLLLECGGWVGRVENNPLVIHKAVGRSIKWDAHHA